MLFVLFISFLVIQRLVEVLIAANNEKWIKTKGGYEVGGEHYQIIVLMHLFFFISLVIEVTILDLGLSSFWPVLGLLFLTTQALRIWALFSLGKFWNTKIMILPNASVIQKGPYKYVRHPNYLIVVAEILVIPVLFQAYVTAILFSVLNFWMLSVRIPIEEKALTSEMDYKNTFANVSRFSPIRPKKM